jgi:hypothetical protein
MPSATLPAVTHRRQGRFQRYQEQILALATEIPVLLRTENVVDLMEALRRSISAESAPKGKKPRKASAGQKEMLMPIEGKKPAKEAAKKVSKPQRRSA